MKITKSLPNPQLDFFLKSYLFFLFTPFILMDLWVRFFYLVGKSFWETRGEGAWLYSIWAVFTGYTVYIFSIPLIIVFIIVFNNKLMSGRKIDKKNKFVLFLLSVVFYIFTLILISFLMDLF